MATHNEPTATIMSPSARHWGALWSDRPRAWALSEQQHAPVYEQTLRHVGLKRGDHALDLGSATGVFLEVHEREHNTPYDGHPA
jgi:cyclopropane fatty-acyl-phospholipid synthase-like methyltransferase